MTCIQRLLVDINDILLHIGNCRRSNVERLVYGLEQPYNHSTNILRKELQQILQVWLHESREMLSRNLQKHYRYNHPEVDRNMESIRNMS